jgi:hypothetical protein
MRREPRIRSFAAGARAWVGSAEARRLLGALGALVALVAVVTGARVALRCARLAGDGARLAYAAATLRLYRRCPDCRRWLRGDAQVCWRCGLRKTSRRWPRSRARFR